MEHISFAVIGGDYRMAATAGELAGQGGRVKLFGFGDGVALAPRVERVGSVGEALDGARYVVLPLPCATDGAYVNAPLWPEKIALEDVLSGMGPESRLFVGKRDEAVARLARKYRVDCADYFEREEMAVENAVPTAEGAIEIAMRELPVTVHGSDCLVLGFGRIGKVLSQKLAGLGARVTVTARKCADLAWIASYGYRAVPHRLLSESLSGRDAIFNTVPQTILGEMELARIGTETLVVDLASKPGGAGRQIGWGSSLAEDRRFRSAAPSGAFCTKKEARPSRLFL